MRKLLFIALLIIACASVSLAQTDDAGPELFLGYSNLQAEGIGGIDAQGDSFDDEVFGERVGLNGFNASITGFISPSFGLTGDISINQQGQLFGVTNDFTEINTRVFNFLGGPTYKFRNDSPVRPFVRVLAGGANTRFEAERRTNTGTATITNRFETSTTDFALAVGGGLDVRVSDTIDLRVIQFDYNPIFLRDRSISVLSQTGTLIPGTLEGQRADNLRFSFGIVLKTGR